MAAMARGDGPRTRGLRGETETELRGVGRALPPPPARGDASKGACAVGINGDVRPDDIDLFFSLPS